MVGFSPMGGIKGPSSQQTGLSALFGSNRPTFGGYTPQTSMPASSTPAMGPRTTSTAPGPGVGDPAAPPLPGDPTTWNRTPPPYEPPVAPPLPGDPTQWGRTPTTPTQPEEQPWQFRGFSHEDMLSRTGPGLSMGHLTMPTRDQNVGWQPINDPETILPRDQFPSLWFQGDPRMKGGTGTQTTTPARPVYQPSRSQTLAKQMNDRAYANKRY